MSRIPAPYLSLPDSIDSIFSNLYLAKFTFQLLFTNTVYQECVIETVIEQQRVAIVDAIAQAIIDVIRPETNHPFQRKLDQGEQGVLNLALELKASAIIMDDKKARNEAKALGIHLFYTTDILHGAERRGLISYAASMSQLKAMGIYLPE